MKQLDLFSAVVNDLMGVAMPKPEVVKPARKPSNRKPPGPRPGMRPATERVKQFLEDNPGEWSPAQIGVALGIGQTTATYAVRRLVRDGGARIATPTPCRHHSTPNYYTAVSEAER